MKSNAIILLRVKTLETGLIKRHKKLGFFVDEKSAFLYKHSLDPYHACESYFCMAKTI